MNVEIKLPRAVVLNLWVSTPWGHTSDIYITVQNSSKLAVVKWQQNNFTVGVITTSKPS